ncbi:hypothetical protein GGG16DRAFT_60315 [Schizophyllum commune]
MLLALPAAPTQLDEETASLIAQLALADLDEMAGDFSDQQLAFELRAEALETMLRNFGIDPVRAERQARQQLAQRRNEDRRGPPTTTSAPSPAADAAPGEPSGPSTSSAHQPEATTSRASTSRAPPTEQRMPTSSPPRVEFSYSPLPSGESLTMVDVVFAEGYDDVVPVYRYKCALECAILGPYFEHPDSADTISDLDYPENEEEAYEDEYPMSPQVEERLPSPDSDSDNLFDLAHGGILDDQSEAPVAEYDDEWPDEEAPSEGSDEFEEERRSANEAEYEEKLSDEPVTLPIRGKAVESPSYIRETTSHRALYTCEGCYDHTWSTECVDAPCRHHFCAECVERLVRSTLTDESLFPLRCCGQPLADAAVDAQISSTLLAQYQTKRAEYVVSPADRVYCVNARCSAFLGSSMRSPRPIAFSCTACRAATCAQCRQPGHAGLDCIQESTAQFDALVKEKQWQRCPSCGATVDRTDGCPHMVCRCSAEFCYLCGGSYSTAHVCGQTESPEVQMVPLPR